MDTPRSGFLPAFESFWNGWCSGRDNMMLIVCGSATSWILGNLSYNKGGLYGRLTDEIKLSPFTLRECEEYFEHNDIEIDRYDIIQNYMIFGGIPYYLSYYQEGMSFPQNADNMLFGKKPRLNDEYNRLFDAIFVNSNDCKKIVRFLSTRHYGYNREEISKATGIGIGGGLTNTLSALIESDFVMKYVPHGHSNRDVHYKLIDNFCLFWLKHVEPNKSDSSFVTRTRKDSGAFSTVVTCHDRNDLSVNWEKSVTGYPSNGLDIIYKTVTLDNGTTAILDWGGDSVKVMFVDQTYSVDENGIGTNTFPAYTNPAANTLHLEISPDVTVGSVSLYDVSGRLAKTQTTGFETVDISGFAPGVYLMKVTLENGKVFEEKIVKE